MNENLGDDKFFRAGENPFSCVLLNFSYILLDFVTGRAFEERSLHKQAIVLLMNFMIKLVEIKLLTYSNKVIFYCENSNDLSI